MSDEGVGGGVLPCIVLNFFSQTKVEASHGAESGVRGPHCQEDLPHGVEVFIHALLLNGFSLGGEDSCMYPFRKNMEEWYWVLDYHNIFWGAQPCAECLPLIPVGGVFTEGGSVHSHGNRFV